MVSRQFNVIHIGALSMCVTMLTNAPAHAQGMGREAQIVVDANTSEVLYESNAQASRRPASITKVMTLYLLFDALKQGKVSWNDRIAFSRNAANQPPTKLFVGAGNSIPIQTAIEALVLRSANDVATAVAENLAGSEANFAFQMTQKARELGMSNTTFRNASGLPHAEQRTTAEDLAKLAIAIHRDFPDQYHWFSVQQMSWNGQIVTGHNHLIKRMPGMDGLKTGYTRASGFNLAATTQRNGRRIVTVVLGGKTRFERDDLVEQLTESAFHNLGRNAPQFAANNTAYDFKFRDSRDAADAAALIMDATKSSQSNMRNMTLAMGRSGRTLSFERGPTAFQIADVSRRNGPTGGTRSEASDVEPQSSDEDEASSTQLLASRIVKVSPVRTPVAVPVPVSVPVRIVNRVTPKPQPIPIPVYFPPKQVPPTQSASLPTLRGSLEPVEMPKASAQGSAIEAQDVPPPTPAQQVQLAQVTSLPPTPAAAPSGLAPALSPDEASKPTENGLIQVASVESELNGSIDLSDRAGPMSAPQAPSQQMLVSSTETPPPANSNAEEVKVALAPIPVPVAVEVKEAPPMTVVADTQMTGEKPVARKEAAAQRKAQIAEKASRVRAQARQAEVRARELAAKQEQDRQAQTQAQIARGRAVVQVGAFKSKTDASAAITQFARYFPTFAQREVTSVNRQDGIWYRARFAGLGALAAKEACSHIVGRGGACLIVSN